MTLDRILSPQRTQARVGPRCFALGMLLVLLGLTDGALADAQQPVATVAPFLEDQTLAVVRVDPSRVDLPAAARSVAELWTAHARQLGVDRAGLPPTSPDQWQQAGRELQRSQAELFVVLNLEDFPTPGPFVLVKPRAEGDAAGLRDALAHLSTEVREQMGDVWFCGSARQLQRLREGRPAVRMELLPAFEAAGNAAVQVIILPSSDHRRVLAEMLPHLPEELGGGNGRPLAAVQWAAAGIHLHPQATVEATLQAADPEAARDLKMLLTSLLMALSRQAAVKEIVPKIDDLAAVLNPRVEGSRLRLALQAGDGSLARFTAALAAPLEQAQAQTVRYRRINDLKHLALAMHNYHDRHHRFPPAASRTVDGKPLLSWRVHLLPYLEQQHLYEQFRLDEPWDSDHNRQLIARMPEIFAGSDARRAAEGRTTYLVPTGPQTVFPEPASLRIRDIRDGTVNTIMIVDVPAEQAVIWTQPEDLPIPTDKPLPAIAPAAPRSAIGGQHRGAIVAFCDGSVHVLPHDLDEKVLRLLIDPRDGQVVPGF